MGNRRLTRRGERERVRRTGVPFPSWEDWPRRLQTRRDHGHQGFRGPLPGPNCRQVQHEESY